jgi:predicted Zn finger-like uncharacterized protein
MYTRCPECHTAFRITVAQLKARDGLVRCGRCNAVFRADLRLFGTPTEGNEGIEEYDEIELASPPDTTIEYEHEPPGDGAEIPTVSELTLFLKPKRWLHPAVWIFGVFAMTLTLVGQFAYFYRDELGHIPELRPLLDLHCRWLHCEIAAPPPITPELLETTIAPHPRYANVLRVRATMVNRSGQPQPLPLMQLTLTASDGKLLARRSFRPRDYLDAPATAAQPLPSNIVVNAVLDVTNPDGRATGYEIKLFPVPPVGGE